MKSNAMELPPKYVVNLYLAALGSPYKTLESMIQVLPSTQRTISKVMQLAKDHIVEDNDEADVNMAMAAKHKRKYHESAYAAQQQKGGCTVCHHPYHTQEECFRQGGAGTERLPDGKVGCPPYPNSHFPRIQNQI